MSIQVAKNLVKARGLIENPDHWCQGHWHWNAFLNRPEQHCAIGALAAVMALGASYADTTQEYAALMQAMGDSPEAFNDSHTHAEVLAAFDRAIEAEARE